MTPDEILHDFARDDIFPKAAMAAARADRVAMALVFVDLIHRLGTQRMAEMEEAAVMALIPVFHLLGEWREPSAHPPLVHLLRRPTEVLDHLLGDAVTETAFRVLAGTFDGDLEPLFAAIDDGKADDFARSSCMHALVLIAQLHPEHRDAIVGVFRYFLTHCPKPSEIVLTGWVDAIADLGLEDMTEQVRAVFDDGRISPDYCAFEHFLDDLRATLDAGGAPAGRRYRKSLITDAIDELSKWHCYTDAFFDEAALAEIAALLRGLRTERDAEQRWTQSVGEVSPSPELTERGRTLEAGIVALVRLHAAAAVVVDARRAEALAAGFAGRGAEHAPRT